MSVYREKIIEDLLRSRKELLDDLKAINDALELISISSPAQEESTPQSILYSTLTNPNSPGNYLVQYKTGWSMKQKILFVIRNEGRFLRLNELRNILLLVEKDKDLGWVGKKLYALMHPNYVHRLERKDNDKKAAWGLPEWVDDNGNVLPGKEPLPSNLHPIL